MIRRRPLAPLIALVLAVGAGAAQSRAAESTTGAPAAEAWYPIGVGTVLAPTYPEATLHVGAAAGQETDRTYLRFDLSSLPSRAEVDAIVVTVPLADDAGTSSPESATVLACAVPGGFDDGGGDAAPPEVTCDGAPAATVTAEVLTVDVTPLARGDVVDLALVPGGGDTWHLGFDSRARDGGTPAGATATYDLAPSSTTTAPNPSASDEVAAGPPVTFPTPGAVAVAPPPAPPTAVGSVIAEQAAVPRPAPAVSMPVTSSTGGRGFLYPVVFALPIVMVVTIGLVGDGLLRPVQLREEAV